MNLTEEKQKYNDGEYLSEPCALCGHLPIRPIQAIAILGFLDRSLSHLTPQGRERLLSFSAQQIAPSSEPPSPSPNRTASELNSPPHLELFGFFRHWHIEVLCKSASHNELYTLVTSHRFLKDPKVVWERLDADQRTPEYFDSTFQNIKLSTAYLAEYVPHVLPILY
jgi:hypothetical protein